MCIHGVTTIGAVKLSLLKLRKNELLSSENVSLSHKNFANVQKTCYWLYLYGYDSDSQNTFLPPRS